MGYLFMFLLISEGGCAHNLKIKILFLFRRSYLIGPSPLFWEHGALLNIEASI
jgi:hypothetical protein